MDPNFIIPISQAIVHRSLGLEPHLVPSIQRNHNLPWRFDHHRSCTTVCLYIIAFTQHVTRIYILWCEGLCNIQHPSERHLNSLTPGKFEWNFKYVIFKCILGIDGWGLSCEISLIWMSLDFTDDQSTLAHIMAWCRQAASHYVSQSWPRSLSPYGVTRPQWISWNLICP